MALRSGGRHREGAFIFASLSTSSTSASLKTGVAPGSGTFYCLNCGSQLSLRETDRLPACPRCRGSSFRRDSIFEPMQDHGQQTAEFFADATSAPPDWLEGARGRLQGPGHYLVCRDDGGKIRSFAVEEGWTRIGRSVTADIRLDVPSVSRRHALIVCEPGRKARVMDDRSLNGIFLNGEIVEWSRLADGDELTIGRYRLYALER